MIENEFWSMIENRTRMYGYNLWVFDGHVGVILLQMSHLHEKSSQQTFLYVFDRRLRVVYSQFLFRQNQPQLLTDFICGFQTSVVQIVVYTPMHQSSYLPLDISSLLFVSIKSIKQCQMITIFMSKFHSTFFCLFQLFLWTLETILHR